MAMKTYRYQWKPLLLAGWFSTAPTATEVTGGPVITDVTIDEDEKDAMDRYMKKYCWDFDQELP